MPDETAIPFSKRFPMPPDEVIILFASIFVVFKIGGSVASAWLGDATVTVFEWLILALPVFVFVRLHGLSAQSSLRFRMPRLIAWPGAVLLATGMIGAGVLMMALQDALLSEFGFYKTQMEFWSSQLTAMTPGGLLVLSLTIGLTPAFCEETLFRGLLLRGLAPMMRPLPLCILVGVLFGVFHGDVLQLVPASIIGAVIAWLALVTNSILPGMLLHFLFNMTTLVARFLAGPEAAASAPSDPWQLALCAALAVTLIPTAVLILRPRREPGSAAPRPSAADAITPQRGENA
jgi:membrane protease YdiL (CAAX protease family)